jgi:CheY-like chemotaxis protein
MNGEIWVESPSRLTKSDQNPGSRFNFTIEAFSNVEMDKDLDFSDIAKYDEIRALIITHNKTTKKRLYGFLEQHNINADTLHFGEHIVIEIKEKLGKKGINYHTIIIVDEPGLDGLWLAKKLQDEGLTNNYRLIMLSSNHKPENYIRSRLSGVDYYIVQPFEHKILKSYFLECFPNIPDTEEHKGLAINPNLKILVAEDNLINQKVAENIFRNLGFSIEIANDGVEVLEIMKVTEFDIIFMDLEMPDKDGIEATIELRSLGYQIPIVAMTASASEATKKDSLNAGMNEYTTKPVKTETVMAILEKWFA